jgi:hypothetical protein
MDDFNVSALHESKNEWGSRLVTLLTPLIIDGYKSILNESIKLCKDNNEMEKYLMTFQNLISRIPKWNQQIVENEKKRICEKSGCNYLEDLVTCVHIIQLKILTSMRVGQKQKKIDISIPKLDDFIHKVYINVARKVYKNVYLFQINIEPLQVQKNYRELEIIVQECILNAIRESIPTEAIIRAYMDETVEQEEEVIIEKIEEPEVVEEKTNTHDDIEENDTSFTDPIRKEEDIPSVVPAIQNIDNEQVVTRLTFNDMDAVMDEHNNINKVSAPKTIDRLEEISTSRALQRKLEEMEDDDDDEDRIRIHTDTIDLTGFDDLDNDKSNYVTQDFVLDDIEVLDSL